MYFKFVCPSCTKGLKVREEHVGKRTRCPYCKRTITITAPNESEEPAEQEVDPLDQLAAAGSGQANLTNPAPWPSMPPTGSMWWT